MRALFLDFDGVLHDATETSGLSPLVPLLQIREARPAAFVHAARLAMLLAGHDDVRVVVHSSWRNLLDDDELGALLPELVAWYAGSVQQPFRGRLEAIRAWLHTHRPRDFRILDDEPAFFFAGCPQLIVCDRRQGLSDPQAEQALRAWLHDTAPAHAQDGLPQRGAR